MAKLGKGDYDEALMSEEDFATAQRNKELWAAANSAGDQAGKQSAQDANAALRAKYGYSGGQDGSGYEPLRQAATEVTQQEFNYANAPSYASKYQSQIDALTKQLLSRPAFEYDHTKDPLYQQYEKTYTRQGERAMQDTLGQVSARTGGLASSYATTASQQTYNNYMDALGDKIPELQQLAYSMYRDEGADQRSDLNMLLALEQGDYSRYMGALGQYNQDRGFNYGVYGDSRNFNYQLGRDAVSDGRYEDEFAYKKEQDALGWAYQKDSDAYNRAIQNWTLTGKLNEADAKVLGIPAGTLNTDYQYQLAQIAAMQAKTTASGGSGGTGGKTQDYDGLYAAAYASRDPKSFIENNYKKYGFTSKANLTKDYEEWIKTPIDNGLGDFSTLVGYTKKGLSNGRSPEQMYSTLKGQGYSDAVIDQVFAQLGL